MNSKLASKRFSSEKSSVLTKEALQELNLHEFDILPHWEPTAGKIYTKVRAISARINQNFDGWPSEELKKAYRTFLGKPVFVNHVNDDPRKARGVVVAARFVENGDDKFIEVIQEVDADRFPKLAHELSSGGLDSVSMGAEARICKCSYCGNEASDMLSMCSHVLSKKGQVLGRVNDDGTRDDVLVYEECRDVSFFELSYVFDPADETAVVSNVLTANKKRGYGETSLPPQVDTLRDEEEDLAGYFIEPPQEFQEPDLDQEYPALDEGDPSANRRDEDKREDVQMTRVSRNRRRAGYEDEWHESWPPLSDKGRATGIDWEALDNALGYDRRDPNPYDDLDPRRQSNRRGRNMSHNRRARRMKVAEPVDDYNKRLYEKYAPAIFERAMEGFSIADLAAEYGFTEDTIDKWLFQERKARRRRFAEDRSRNDQGEQEEVFISQTPPAEPVETGEGAADAPNNTQSDRVKTDQNRGTHTNFEARRRRPSRRARRRSTAANNLHMLDDMQVLDGYATVSMGLEEGWGEDEGMTQEDLQEYTEELERRGIDPYNNDVYSSRRRRPSRRARRRMAEQSDDFNIDSHADIARDVEDEEVFVSETGPETQPKDASRRRRSSKRRRRMADTNLDLAAPDGRVNVEAPTADTTDEEAQASQFDKKDFANNAGDHLADPDLSTDQNWAPGEGKTSNNRASQIEGMRLAEAMVEAGLESHDDRWKLAEAYTKLPATIVRDRIALLARTANKAKQASNEDKSQRPVKSARKAPGLGQRPTLQKSANKSDDYTLFF